MLVMFVIKVIHGKSQNNGAATYQNIAYYLNLRHVHQIISAKESIVLESFASFLHHDLVYENV